MTTLAQQEITGELIEMICARLRANQPVRQRLPQWGRLHIERQLPFLCIYRRPVRRPDPGTPNLIMGQASYLIASADRRNHEDLSRLVRAIVETLSPMYDSFFLLEVWSVQDATEIEAAAPSLAAPGFNIISLPETRQDKTMHRLETALSRIVIDEQTASIRVMRSSTVAPPRMLPLMDATAAHDLHCHTLGLGVRPIYRHHQRLTILPREHQSLTRQMTKALQRAAFHFVRLQTPLQPRHYQALGRRALVRDVWDIDAKLAEISAVFSFLLQFTPINTDAAWAEFKRSHFQRAPEFRYRPQPNRLGDLKRRLWSIEIDRLEDPTLEFLFREKQQELDTQLSMLYNQNTPRFLYGSLQLYGSVDDDLVDTARRLTEAILPRSRETSPGTPLNAVQFAERARQEIAYYRQQYPELTAEATVRNDVVTLMVAGGSLLVGRSYTVPESRVMALLQHEIGTHILTYHNGSAQPFRQLRGGLAGYEELQEGLAVLAEYLAGGLSKPRLRLLAGRVIAARCAVDGASFIETFRQLTDVYHFSQYTAYLVTMRIFRGGGLTKDAIYLRGFIHLLAYLQNGGELAPLFVGKIAAHHVPIIRELQRRQVLKPVPLTPRYMNFPQTENRLAQIRQGITVFDLIHTTTRDNQPST